MSSTFSFENWVSILDAVPVGAPSPAVSSALASASPSSQPGEFQPFVSVSVFFVLLWSFGQSLLWPDREVEVLFEGGMYRSIA
jgi:hypothetical protein